MPAWTMPGTSAKAELLAEARATTARDHASLDRTGEDLHAQAAIMAMVEATCAEWTRGAHLGTSRGPWVDLHAQERGEHRQADEADLPLIARLRTPPDALTLAALQEVADQILTSAGGSGSAILIRVPRDAGAFAGSTSGGTIQSFANRGDRTWHTGRGHLVVILPAGTSDGVAASVLQAVKAKSTAGSSVHVEIATT